MKLGPFEFVLILLTIGIPVGLIWVVFKWIRFFTRKKGGGNPLDTAKERYAKGEISKAEFEEIKKNIS
jgi:uncharacterized membrane protein